VKNDWDKGFMQPTAGSKSPGSVNTPSVPPRTPLTDGRFESPRAAPLPPGAKKDKPPPVAPRPQHTLSIYSTDISKPPQVSLKNSQLAAPEKQMKQIALDVQTASPVPPPKAPARKENQQQPSVSADDASVAPAPSDTQVVAPTQRRQKSKTSEDFLDRLRAIVNPDDPTKLYKNFVKIGQGYFNVVWSLLIT
jgi:hypothetical protein